MAFTDILQDALLDAAVDTIKIIPFLFLAYLLIEVLENKTDEKTIDLIHHAGPLGPVIGGALGVIPQCGFSAATANLYTGGLITRGTLLAVFLSTSDEMLAIFISKSVPFAFIAKVLVFKLFAGMAAGILADFIEKRFGTSSGKHLHDICEQEGCNCEEGVLRSALFHTAKVSAFLLATTLLINIAVGLVGTEHLAGFILNRPVVGELLSGIVGLIPNCAASVVITQLYLQGGMSSGAMITGLLTGAGVGLLVLFRMNRNIRDNLITLAALYGFGVFFGMIASFLPIF